jgi:mannose-6-phosphate isomerase-like protein (cupin superfamily)
MLRKQKHHIAKSSPFCGEIIEILSSRDYSRADIAMVVNIKPTHAHFHKNFEEIYLVIDGNIALSLYDPQKNETCEVMLEPHELFVIAPGIHHKVTASSGENRLCVICLPGFDAIDEHVSSML